MAKTKGCRVFSKEMAQRAIINAGGTFEKHSEYTLIDLSRADGGNGLYGACDYLIHNHKHAIGKYPGTKDENSSKKRRRAS